ncbi:kinetochore-associated Ndc80 complex subunit spc24 [Saguinus oedipus]|uniref:Kinetochore protein Spc24 n=1 Tax=Saguinus oedipus TaxID=9490 RepID=A0ABQ9TS69_SAGOE|nr:kinetochore-associated Ndc80 complex subunit spc24 [Saguinus oedipus]
MAAFRDMEEVSQGLLSLLGTNRAEAQQRRLLGHHEQVVERLLETQDGAEKQLHEILTMEKEVAESLLNAKEQVHQGGVDLQQLEAGLQEAREEDAQLKSSLLYPFLQTTGVLNYLPTQLTRELEELKEIEADLERQKKEVDEDTTVTIPSAVYVAQLYHQISKIEWDYEFHHGPSVAQPIHLDSTQLSKKFISDYLWSLVDTKW